MLAVSDRRFFSLPLLYDSIHPTTTTHSVEGDQVVTSDINASDIDYPTTVSTNQDALITEDNNANVNTSLVKEIPAELDNLLALRNKVLSPIPNQNRLHKERYPGLQPAKTAKAKRDLPVFQTFNELKRNANKLFQFKGTLQVDDDKFTVRLTNGIAEVQAEFSENEDKANEIQRLINNYALYREDTIQSMSHDQLPPALQRLTPDHWNKIGQAVLDQTDHRQWPDFSGIMGVKFHDDIYITMSSHIEYTFSADVELRKERWCALIAVAKANPEWKPDGIQYGRCTVQVKKSIPDDANFARLYLRYHSNPTVSRLQFVVTSGAGQALYNDLAKLMDDYIKVEYKGNPLLSPVKSFKVFSEDRQLGRSDSAVIYLSEALHHQSVLKLVSYLDSALAHKLASVSVIGAMNMGNSYVQGATIPEKARQVSVFNRYIQSNGALVKNVLIHAYRQGYMELRKTPSELTLGMLNQRAQYYSKALWKQLGLSRALKY